jgi:hypothetical protein
LCDTVEQLFTHLSSLGVKWSQVQILSARPEFLQVEAVSEDSGTAFSHTYQGYG